MCWPTSVKSPCAPYRNSWERVKPMPRNASGMSPAAIIALTLVITSSSVPTDLAPLDVDTGLLLQPLGEGVGLPVADRHVLLDDDLERDLLGGERFQRAGDRPDVPLRVLDRGQLRAEGHARGGLAGARGRGTWHCSSHYTH